LIKKFLKKKGHKFDHSISTDGYSVSIHFLPEDQYNEKHKRNKIKIDAKKELANIKETIRQNIRSKYENTITNLKNEIKKIRKLNNKKIHKLNNKKIELKEELKKLKRRTR